MSDIQKRFSLELQNNIILDPNEENFYGDTKAPQIREGSEELIDMSNFDICTVELGVNEVDIVLQNDSSCNDSSTEPDFLMKDTSYFQSMDEVSNDKNITQVWSWDQLQSSLQTVFPNDKQYSYVVESYKELPCEEFTGTPAYAFEAQVCINIGNESDAKQWLSKVYSHSKCTFRHTRGIGNKTKGKRILHKAYLHCQHQCKALILKQTEQPKKKLLKHPLLQNLRNKKTSCHSTIKLTVNIPTKKDKRAAKFRPYLLSHTTIVNILHNHNHPIDSGHALTSNQSVQIQKMHTTSYSRVVTQLS